LGSDRFDRRAALPDLLAFGAFGRRQRFGHGDRVERLGERLADRRGVLAVPTEDGLDRQSLELQLLLTAAGDAPNLLRADLLRPELLGRGRPTDDHRARACAYR